MINVTHTQGDPGELAGREPNNKCWGDIIVRGLILRLMINVMHSG